MQLGEVKKKKHSQDYKETHNFFNSVPLECLPASRGTRCFKKETKSTVYFFFSSFFNS